MTVAKPVLLIFEIDSVTFLSIRKSIDSNLNFSKGVTILKGG